MTEKRVSNESDHLFAVGLFAVGLCAHPQCEAKPVHDPELAKIPVRWAFTVRSVMSNCRAIVAFTVSDQFGNFPFTHGQGG